MKALFTLLAMIALTCNANAQTNTSRTQVNVLSMHSEEAQVEILGPHTFSVGSIATLTCDKTSVVVVVRNVSGTTITLIPLVSDGKITVPYNAGQVMTIEPLGVVQVVH